MAGLDLTFDQDGILPISIDNTSSTTEQITNIKLLPGGKFLVAGRTNGAQGFLQRRNADGSLDVNFDLGSTSFLVSADPIITSDSKVVVYTSTQIRRYNSDGSLDTSFAGSGIYNSSSGINELLVRLNPNTKSNEIIFSERAGFFAQNAVTISFLNASGTITPPPISGLPQGVNSIPFNPVFVTDVLYNRANPNDAGIALTNQVLGSVLTRLREELVPQNRVIDSINLGFVQADGSILVSFNSNGGSNPQFFAVRLNSNFQADANFGTNGILKSSGIAIIGKVDDRNDSFYLVKPEAAGKTSITHYTKDGKLDPSFGVNGKADVPDFLYTNSINYKPFLDIDSQGRVVGGRIEDGKITLARLNSNGTLDTTIGINGKLELPFDGTAVITSGNGVSAILSADDRILVVGSTKNSQDGLIAKYDITGSSSPSEPPNNPPTNSGNNAPVASEITNKSATSGTGLNFSVASGFKDMDTGDILIYTATRVDGSPLPAWLAFNSTTGIFTGTPAVTDIGSLNLRVKATDKAGLSSANSDFTLSVTTAPSVLIPGVTIAQNLFSFDKAINGFSVSALSQKPSNKVNQILALAVDDATGTIDGLTPSAPGYLAALLDRAKPVFSTLGGEFFNSSGTQEVAIDPAKVYQFIQIQDASIADLKLQLTKGIVPTNILYSLGSADSPIKVTNNSTNDGYKVSINNDELVLNVGKLTGAAPNPPIGSGLQNAAEGRLIDLTAFAGQMLKVDLTTKSSAAYNNNIGFYQVEDAVGTIKLADGKLLTVDNANYALEAVKKAVLTANKTDSKANQDIAGGAIYAPVMVSQGTLADFISKNPTNGGGGDAIHAYFNYVGANPDKVDHFRLLGGNTFGVEDIYGGGDRDFNDVVINMNIKTPIAFA